MKTEIAPRPSHGHSARLEGVAAEIQHPALRDIAWLLHTPDIVTLPGTPGRPCLKALGWPNDEALTHWLARQRPAVEALPWRTLRQSRMGHYHERLWHYVLDHAPHTHLLARNVRVFQRRNTLGELDILYRSRFDPAPIHLEVAIKFYLGLADGPGGEASLSRWIGPGGLDSLALKCHHTARHQLPIARTPPAREALRHWLAPRDSGEALAPLRSQFALPGVLFYPWHTRLTPPNGATATHRRGLWCYRDDWPSLAASMPPDTLAAWLEKPCWLAPPPLARFRPLRDAVTAALDRVIADNTPQQVMLHFPNHDPTQRVFIVPNGWPRQIPLPPR